MEVDKMVNNKQTSIATPEALCFFPKLSPREKELARAIISQSTIKAVAQNLGLSLHTVTRYAVSLRCKIKAPNTIAAAYKAKSLGLLD